MRASSLKGEMLQEFKNCSLNGYCRAVGLNRLSRLVGGELQAVARHAPQHPTLPRPSLHKGWSSPRGQSCRGWEALLSASLLSALCVFVESSQKKSEIGAGFFSSKWFLIVRSQATEKIVPNPDSAVFKKKFIIFFHLFLILLPTHFIFFWLKYFKNKSHTPDTFSYILHYAPLKPWTF